MEKQNAIPGGIGLVLFALAMGGFAIGTTEFATMSLLPISRLICGLMSRRPETSSACIVGRGDRRAPCSLC